MEIRHVLVGDLSDRYIINADFILFDQVQKQVERSFKSL